MSVAQVIRLDERQAIGRPRRKHATPCVILQLHRAPARRAATVTTAVMPDEDCIAGRGRDPG